MTSIERYRSSVVADDAIAEKVIAFSISYQRENMLARGMGLEHLRELLIRLARPILRQRASLAYGGHWNETEDNFLFTLLRLISAEQEDESSSDTAGDSSSAFVPKIGKLYNHSPWPGYLDVTPMIEAQWINSCRIVRITQQEAGFPDAEIVPDANARQKDARTLFNKAITLSAMRRLMMQPMSIGIPDAPPEQIPAVIARILLGGKVDSYSGFLPGIFEEALVTLQWERPVYLLGGFGGASEILAKAMLARGNDRPEEFTLDWHKARNPDLVTLLTGAHEFAAPAKYRDMEKSLDELFALVLQARADLCGTLRTGLNDEDTRELLQTSNIANAVHLVRAGLVASTTLPPLPA